MKDKCEWKEEELIHCRNFHIKVVNISQVEKGLMCGGCGTMFNYSLFEPESKTPSHEEIAIENLSLATGLSMVKAKNLIEAVISAYENEE